MLDFQGFKFRYFKQSIVALIITIAFLLINGFLFPANNNTYHIPIVLNVFNSVEGPHDPYTKSLDRFVSIFWLVLKQFTNEDNIYLVFLGAYIVCLFVTALIYLILISDTLQEEKTWTGLIAGGSIFLMMSKESVIGHNEVLATYLTHSQVTIPFVLLAILLLSRCQYVGAAALLGVAFNINAFMAIWGGLISGLTMLVVNWSQKRSFCLRTGVAMFGVFTLFALPTATWIWRTIGSSSDYETFNYIEYLRQFYSLHNLIDTQKKMVPVAILLVLLMWSLILFVGKIQTKQKQAAFSAIGLGLTLVLILGAFLPYLTESRLLNNLYPLRMDAFVHWLIVILAGIWFADIGKQDSGLKVEKIGVWASLLNFNVLLTSFLLLDSDQGRNRSLKFLVLASTGVACALTIFKGTWSILTPYMSSASLQDLSIIIILLQCFMLGVIASEADQLQRFFALSPLAWGFMLNAPGSSMVRWLVLMSLLSAVLSFFNKRAHPLAYICAGLLPPVIFISTHSFLPSFLPWFAHILYASGYLIHRNIAALTTLRFRSSHLPALILVFLLTFGGFKTVARGGINSLGEQALAFNETQQWARSHTAPDTMFLPINSPGFSVLSRRPVWVDVKWGAVVMWAPELYPTWLTRTEAVQNISSLSAAIKLARSQNIAYIVAPISFFESASFFQPGEVVYQNQHYAIYRVL